MEYQDKNGNKPEEGGKLFIANNEWLFIRGIMDSFIITDDGNNDHDCDVYYLPKLIEEQATFEPKPEEPKRETPPDGVPVKVIKNGEWIVRISSGRLDENGWLICYPGGKLSGFCSDHGWKEWDLIK